MWWFEEFTISNAFPQEEVLSLSLPFLAHPLIHYSHIGKKFSVRRLEGRFIYLTESPLTKFRSCFVPEPQNSMLMSFSPKIPREGLLSWPLPVAPPFLSHGFDPVPGAGVRKVMFSSILLLIHTPAASSPSLVHDTGRSDVYEAASLWILMWLHPGNPLLALQLPWGGFWVG